MATCAEDLDALFEEAWNRIPHYDSEQCSDDHPNSLCDDRTTPRASRDVHNELTEQNGRMEEEIAPLGKAVREADSGNPSQAILHGLLLDTHPNMYATSKSSSPHGTSNYPESPTDGTGDKAMTHGVQDLGEIKEEFDVFEVKHEPGDDSNEFTEQQHVLDITEGTSKSSDQPETTSNGRATLRSHLFRAVRANTKPGVYVEEPDVEEPHTLPSEIREEKESNEQDRGNIKSIVRKRTKLKKKEESKKKYVENVYMEEPHMEEPDGEEPDVEEPYTPPSEMEEETESTDEDCRNIKRIGRERKLKKKEEMKEKKAEENSHLKEPSCLKRGSNDFYRGLKKYQLRGKFTDICIDEVRDNFEKVVVNRRHCFRCKLCSKTLGQVISAIKHCKSHLRGDNFFCGKCGRKFKSKFSFDIHLEFHAQGQWREIPGPSSRPFACSMCHKFFPTRALLSSHRMAHTEELPYRCGVCDRGFRGTKRRDTHEHTHQRVKKKLECPVCGQALTCTESFASHMRRHKYYKAEIEAYACDKCPETFVSAPKLFDHIKARHPPRPFSETCEKCGRSFCYPAVLQQHQQSCCSQPGAERTTFPCKVCGKVFAKSMLLCRHKKIHSSTRPFKCRHCDMAFRQSDARHRHEMLHFKDGEFRDVTRHTWKVSHGKDGRQLR
ncbi:uncharacterized protein [Diadema setosum]|uniref:uncharacterized protein n=1 Tax=Diadema setosum TaxID=31175 RepID=UPI003B3B837B